MKTKKILLALILIIGINFQNCSPFNCDCPPVDYEYFDINGIDMRITKRTENGIENVSEDEVVNFSDLYYIELFYNIDYISHNTYPKFSLINSAFACSCADNGYKGSKNEKLDRITIITLNDFDSNYLANDTINNLFEIGYTEVGATSIDKYLDKDTTFIDGSRMDLYLQKAPELDENFKIKIIVELSTNEIYEKESSQIKIIEN